MGKLIEDIPCYCLKLRTTAKKVTDYYNTILEPSGITIAQFLFLMQLSAHSGCSVTALANACELDTSTMTRNLKPLLRQGLVANVKEAGTRNSKLILTEQGNAVRREANQLWLQAQEAFRERLGEKGVNDLVNALLVLQDL